MHQLGSSNISTPFILRLVRRSTLKITSPPIVLKGIRNAAGVRDFLRDAGQIEGQRMEKTRWRNILEG